MKASVANVIIVLFRNLEEHQGQLNIAIFNNPMEKISNNFFKPLNEPSKNIIHSIWQTNRSTLFKKEFILPKGVIEIIFNFSKYSKTEAQINNRLYLLADCFINGYNTFPIQ